MHQCTLWLLVQQDDEESLKCLCRLLSTIGKEFKFPNPQQANATRTASISVSQSQYMLHDLAHEVKRRQLLTEIGIML